MIRTAIYIFLFLFISRGIQGQSREIQKLNFFADVVNNAHSPDHRQMAFDSLSEGIKKYLDSDVYSYDDLDALKYVSLISPQDSSFKLVTWQLEGKEDYRYSGYIITPDGYTQLQDRSGEIRDAEYSMLSPDKWYGAIYYNVKKFSKGNNNYYVLFGYNGYKNQEHQKLADVLTFHDGKPEFGKEIFYKAVEQGRPDEKARLILTYSRDAQVTINYNPSLDMITLDHLVTRMGYLPGQGPTSLPDGSYVGYEWSEKDGRLNYIDKIYHQTFDTPPSAPKSENTSTVKRDIFGRKVDK